jgi:hypothetical protein
MNGFNKRELQEWMGMTRADLCVYLAFAAVTAMFFVRSSAGDIGLAVVAFALTIASCPLGMKSDPDFEDVTNLMKVVSYPAAVVIVAFAILMHYVLIAYGHPECAAAGLPDFTDAARRFAAFLDSIL